MFLCINSCLIFLLFGNIVTVDILLPSSLINNQSLSSLSSVYLCHLYQLNNLQDFYLEGYNIINGGTTGHVHHLLVYECSIKDRLEYSGLCGMYNRLQMPESVYNFCQTRIIIAWAQGGQLKYDYPTGTGLKLDLNTQLLLEIHFEPTVPHNHSIGIQLRFHRLDETPQHEIGVLTMGTLAHSPLFLPPGLDRISFPTYCFNDCLKYFLKTNAVLNIFSILVHAHRRATRITLKFNNQTNLIDQNPFLFHRQENHFFDKPYPKVNSLNELILTCYYSTKNDHFIGIHGGYNSNEEMCQAFLYYYPKIDSFPLCLSLPIYKNKHFMNNDHKWTRKQSLLMKFEIESNRNHLSMCGDNMLINNKTILRTNIYQRSIENQSQYSSTSINFPKFINTCFIYSTFVFLIYCFIIFSKYLHSLYNGDTF